MLSQPGKQAGNSSWEIVAQTTHTTPSLPPWPLRCFLHCCSKDPPVTRVPTSKASLVSNPSLARYDLVFAVLLYLMLFHAISKPSKHLWGQTTQQFHGCIRSRQNCCWIFKWHVKQSNFGTPFFLLLWHFPSDFGFPLEDSGCQGSNEECLAGPKSSTGFFWPTPSGLNHDTPLKCI